MLGKLLKYEIRATARIFLPLYAVLLIFAFINRILSLSFHEWKTPEVISMILYMTILIGMFVMTLVVMIQRFYKNLLSEEGYLMFTLPTKTWKHIISKLFIAMMWTLVSGLMAMISIFIIAFDKVLTKDFFQSVINSVNELYAFLGGSSFVYLLEFLIAGIISLASNVLIIYASIAIGHLFNRHRILSSLGAFIVLSTVSQIFFAVMSAIFGAINEYGELFVQNNLQPIIHFTTWYTIVFSGLLSAGYFLVTNYILSKRLNLE